MKAVMRACALLLICSLVPAAFAADARTRKGKSPKAKSAVVRTDAARAENSLASSGVSTATDAMPRGSATLFPARPAPAALPQAAKGDRETKEPFKLRPMPSTGGALGVFTVESAYLLPKRAYAISGYANKVSRMPGNITALAVGWTISAGVTEWFNVHVGWEAYRYIHVSRPNQLSFNTPVTNPPYPSPPAPPTIYRGLTTTPGSAPGYVEDFPFANRNLGGIGDFVVGFRLGPWSEWRGDKFSLSIRNDFYIPTKRSLGDLLDNGTQTGQFNWAANIAVSRTWWKDRIVSNWNLGYRITRDPRSNRVRMLTQADQLRLATGTIFFPKSRIQVMTETVATIYTGQGTQNTTLGPRDVVESVWGIRFYPFTNFAVDAGYRRANYLDNHGDKNGFVIKVGVVHWREK